MLGNRAPVRNPEQRAALVADPELIPKAVEEILRMEAAIIPGRRGDQGCPARRRQHRRR